MPSYTQEFRAKAVHLAAQIGTAEAAEQCGVHPETLKRWQNRATEPSETEETAIRATVESLEIELAVLTAQRDDFCRELDLARRRLEQLEADLSKAERGRDGYLKVLQFVMQHLP